MNFVFFIIRYFLAGPRNLIYGPNLLEKHFSLVFLIEVKKTQKIIICVCARETEV